MNKEEAKIIKAMFKAKSKTVLETGVLRDFNSCCMTIKVESIMVLQKNQVKKLILVNIKNNAKEQ